VGEPFEADAPYRNALALAETHPGGDSEAVVLAAVHFGRALQRLGDMKAGKASWQRAMARGSVALRQAFPAAAATMRRLEMALDMCAQVLARYRRYVSS